MMRALLHGAAGVALVVLSTSVGCALRGQSPGDMPQVLVARHELRVVFPRDTSSRWGWFGLQDTGTNPRLYRYAWNLDVDATVGPRSVGVAIEPTTSGPRTFASLNAILDAARPYVCSYGMAISCGEPKLTAAVEAGRPVLVVRDSVLIAHLFALHPTFVRLSQDHPDVGGLVSWDRVPVEYRAPALRPLSPGAHAAASDERRLDALDRFSVRRRIAGGQGLVDRMWIVVGDSVPLWLLETQHTYDTSFPGQRDLSDSGWAVLDPRLARLSRPDTTKPIDGFWTEGRPRMFLKALEPGATRIRVRGVHGRLDAAVVSEIAPGVVERALLVILPPHSIRIVPRPDTVRAGKRFGVRVRVHDAYGGFTERIPLPLVVDGEAGSYFFDGNSPSRIHPSTTGRMTLTAQLDALGDTLVVTVIESTAPLRPR